MLPKYHIIYGFLICFVLYLIFPVIGLFEASLIFFSSLLLDIDHYFYYVYKKKDFSLFNAYQYFIQIREKGKKIPLSERKKYKKFSFPFHGIEFLIFPIILSFFFQTFFWILLGFSIHLLLDYYDLKKLNDPIFLKISQIYTYFYNKNKKEIK